MVTESERIVLEAFAAVDARDNERLKRISHPEASFVWPESLRPNHFRTVRGEVATSWEEVWEPFQPLPEFITRKMSPQIVASSGARVTVLWHQRGVNRRGERLDCEVLGLYEVRDGLLYRANVLFRWCGSPRISSIERYQISRLNQSPNLAMQPPQHFVVASRSTMGAITFIVPGG